MTETSQAKMLEVWQTHVAAEFFRKDADAAVAVMTDDAHVLLVPPITGGTGKAAVRDFYARSFLPQIPPDMTPTGISQTFGADRFVDESVFRFTHTIAMDWMVPGLAPTGRFVEVAVVAIVEFRDGLIRHEHLYWDQASVLIQMGVLAPSGLPVHGAECTERLLAVGTSVGR